MFCSTSTTQMWRLCVTIGIAGLICWCSEKMNVILHICCSLSLNDTDEKECSRGAVSRVSGSTISPSTFLSTAHPHPPQYHWLFNTKIEKGSCKACFNVEDITAVWEHISASSQRIMIIISAHLPKHQSPSSSILPPSPVAFAIPSTCDSNIGLHSFLLLFPARKRSIKSITKLKLAAVTKRNAFAMFGFCWFSCNLLEKTCHDHHHHHHDDQHHHRDHH